MKKILKISFFVIVMFIYGAKAAGTNEETIFLNDLKITSLMRAVANNDVKAAKIFLDNGSSVNEKNIAKVSVVHIAVKNESVDALKLLIQKKANINTFDEEKFTPLMRACIDGNDDIVKILIDAGANIWPENIFGETSLFLAVSNDCDRCVEYIIEKDYRHNGARNSYEYRNKEFQKAIKVAYRKQNKDLETFLTQYKDKITKEVNSKENVNYILDAKKVNEKKFKKDLKDRYKSVLK